MRKHEKNLKESMQIRKKDLEKTRESMDKLKNRWQRENAWENLKNT